MLPMLSDPAALLAGRPCVDVRSPGEFARGAVPSAVNLPILTDSERAAVGKRFKARGQEAAINLGHRLVSGETKRARVAAWRDYATAHPDAVLYCARGGLRSAIAQRWLAAAGVTRPRLVGGFKALRQQCLAVLQAIGGASLVVVGGRTGTGKTRLVASSARGVDLEGLANHRGSAFGALATPQPPPIAFENALAAALNGLLGNGPIVLEDEGRNIGRLSMPPPVFEAMRRAPIVLVEAPLDERVDNILGEYVLAAHRPRERLPAALARIARRLGGVRHREIRALMTAAFEAGEPVAHAELHRRWIRRLLGDYYDPLYDYQLAGKADRVVWRGARREVADYLARIGEGAEKPI